MPSSPSVGTTFSVDIPHGKVVVPSGQEIALSDGRFYIPDLRVDPQQSPITFKANGATATVMQLLDHEPLGYLSAVGLKPDFFGGTATGSFILDMPLKEDLQFKEVKLRGEARLDEAIASRSRRQHGCRGRLARRECHRGGCRGQGQIQIKGVPAELVLAAHLLRARRSAAADQGDGRPRRDARETARLQDLPSGQGPTPSPSRSPASARALRAISMQADLTEAQLLFGSMGWTKPPGRSRQLFNSTWHRAKTARPICKNLKILGDDINIDGAVALDSEQHLKSFYFSDFSIDSITHVEITATVRDDKVLDIKAQGPSYDGKQFFRSLVLRRSVHRRRLERACRSVRRRSRPPTSIRWSASTTRPRATCMSPSRSATAGIVALDAKGDLNGKTPAAVTRDERRRARDQGRVARRWCRLPPDRLLSEVDGGEASARGQSRRRRSRDEERHAMGARLHRAWRSGGERRAHRSELARRCLVASARSRSRRARIDFKQLRAPFSVGGGKFQLEGCLHERRRSSAPPCAARVDFKAQTVDLGGTYVPLYGLNSAFRAIPILGPRARRPAGRGTGRHHLRHQGQARRPVGAGQSRCR